MAHFEWIPALETGNQTIDEQHRSLFALASSLQDAVDSQTADEETVAGCVWQLVDYVVQHFADEEALMNATGFPAAAPHRSLHQHLTSETMTIAARYFNGEDVRPEALAPFVVQWLTEHIASADKEFVRFLSGAQ